MTTSSRRFGYWGLLWLALPAATFAKAPRPPIQLFDGKTFHGWTAKGGGPVTGNWSIEDGTLALNGEGGSLVTADEYGDFDLSFQWKLAAHGNSGVKYRVNFYEQGVHGHPSWLGCEYQIFDDPKSTPTTKHSSGALYDLYPPTVEHSLRPAGEFNDARIVARGTTFEHWLNGVKIVSADMSSDEWKERISQSKFNGVKGFMQKPKGRIELQDHNSRVWFRNLVLTPLD
jgi:3-keto-disaccharide hydrolase